MNLPADVVIDLLELSFHYPKRGVVDADLAFHLPREAFANPRVRMVLIALPPVEHGSTQAVQTWPIALKVAPECPIQKPLGLFARDGTVLKVESVLPVNIGEIHSAEHTALSCHLLIERGSWHWRV